MKCPLCNKSKKRALFSIDNFQIAKCRDCGLVRLDDCRSFEEVKSLYQKSYFENPDHSVGYIDYKSIENSLRLNFKNRARRILSRKGSRAGWSLLDVGTSTGFFLSECQKLGFQVEGIEISPEAIKFARKKLNLKVFKGSLEEFEKRKKYQIITAWDVIEHSLYPNKFLKQVHALLTEDGLFYFSTGDINSLCARVSGRNWHLFNLPDHLFFYSRKTISSMLEKNGFEIVSISYPWNYYELGYLIERLLKKMFGLKNVKLIKAISYNFLTKRILIAVNLFDIMEIVARKV